MLSNQNVDATRGSVEVDCPPPSTAGALKNTLALIAGWAELLAADGSLPEYVRQAARTIRGRAAEAAKMAREQHDSSVSS